MGNTTIIELDHDQADEIEKNPKGFVRIILEQLSAAEHTGHYIPGGKIIAFFHRSGDIDKAWEKFKQKWGQMYMKFGD